MLPPYQRRRKLPFTAPAAVRKLPITLLRDQLSVKDPRAVSQAAQAYRDYMGGQQVPLKLPIAALYQHRKRGPGGVSRGVYRPYTAMASSIVGAMKQARAHTTLSSGLASYHQPLPATMATKQREADARFRFPPNPGMPSPKLPLMRAYQEKRPLVPPPQAFERRGVPARLLPDPRSHVRKPTFLDCKVAQHIRNTAMQNAMKLVVGEAARRIPRTVVPS